MPPINAPMKGKRFILSFQLFVNIAQHFTFCKHLEMREVKG